MKFVLISQAGNFKVIEAKDRDEVEERIAEGEGVSQSNDVVQAYISEDEVGEINGILKWKKDNSKIKNILLDYIEGKMSRETDEKGKDGFWDYAGEIVEPYTNVLMSDDVDILQTQIFNSLVETYERLSD